MPIPKTITSRRYGTLPWPKSLTADVIMNAVDRQNTSLDNPGFCIGCGEESDECEPDARAYECESCNRRLVYGAAELLMKFVA